MHAKDDTGLRGRGGLRHRFRPRPATPQPACRRLEPAIAPSVAQASIGICTLSTSYAQPPENPWGTAVGGAKLARTSDRQHASSAIGDDVPPFVRCLTAWLKSVPLVVRASASSPLRWCSPSPLRSPGPAPIRPTISAAIRVCGAPTAMQRGKSPSSAFAGRSFSGSLSSIRVSWIGQGRIFASPRPAARSDGHPSPARRSRPACPPPPPTPAGPRQKERSRGGDDLIAHRIYDLPRNHSPPWGDTENPMQRRPG